MKDLEFSTGCSNNWDPVSAGKEAAERALSALHKKPKFMLIFSTIHYQKEGGFEKLLKSCRTLVGDIPCVGGTVVGFVSTEGAHTRGVLIVLCSGDIEAITECAKNSRNFPESSGSKLASNIKDKTPHLDSQYKNKLLFFSIAGVTAPKLMFDKNIVKLHNLIHPYIPKKISWLIRDKFIWISSNVFNTGGGEEERTLSAVQKILPEYYFFGFSAFDNIHGLSNFQFCNGNVLRASMSSLAIFTNSKVTLQKIIPVLKDETPHKIRRGWGDYFIDEIDSKDALARFLEIKGWMPKHIHGDISNVRTWYFPLAYSKNNRIYVIPPGGAYGQSIGTNLKIHSDEIYFCSTSIVQIIESINKYVEFIKENKPSFSLITSGFHLIGIFGSKISIIKKIMDEATGGKPYCIIFDTAEHTKLPFEEVYASDYTLNLLTFE